MARVERTQDGVRRGIIDEDGSELALLQRVADDKRREQCNTLVPNRRLFKHLTVV